MDKRPIGLLDSGVGGLTVVKKFIQKMPNESTIFIGDNAHIPYGNKSRDEIIALTWQSVKFLLQQNVKIIVFACNTATAVAMKTIQKQIGVQIVGVIQSGAKSAIKATRNNSVAVIATQMTIAMHAYQEAIISQRHDIRVNEFAAPKLVPLIEKKAGHNVYLKAIRETFVSLNGLDIDTLVLGCTHYPIIQAEFNECIRPGIRLIDPADQVAQDTYDILQHEHLLNKTSLIGRHEYYTTGDVNLVNELGKLVLNEPEFHAQRCIY